jgi:hypothetical protein
MNTKHANSSMTYQLRFRKLTDALLPHLNFKLQNAAEDPNWANAHKHKRTTHATQVTATTGQIFAPLATGRYNPWSVKVKPAQVLDFPTIKLKQYRSDTCFFYVYQFFGGTDAKTILLHSKLKPAQFSHPQCVKIPVTIL